MDNIELSLLKEIADIDNTSSLTKDAQSPCGVAVNITSACLLSSSILSSMHLASTILNIFPYTSE